MPSTHAPQAPLRFNATWMNETEKAFRFVLHRDDRSIAIWVPKSVCQYELIEPPYKDKGIATIQMWFVEKKELRGFAI